ncbi:MAG: NADH-quinone oxidoreductase subunit J [Bacteroidetes bacterium]|nr:NADH-quinone oxidoreductase subunit J [Bacteroidota bacterium]
MLETFLFFLFAVVAVVGALGMLIVRSPVSSALWMIMTLFAIACLYITLDAEFIGVVQVLIYAGAIMVLFLFVIMLLNLDSMPRMEQLDWRKVAAFVLGIVVLAELLAVISLRLEVLPEAVASSEAAEAASANNIGLALLTEHAFSLEMIGVLLLAATIGAVMLAKKKFV